MPCGCYYGSKGQLVVTLLSPGCHQAGWCPQGFGHKMPRAPRGSGPAQSRAPCGPHAFNTMSLQSADSSFSSEKCFCIVTLLRLFPALSFALNFQKVYIEPHPTCVCSSLHPILAIHRDGCTLVGTPDGVAVPGSEVQYWGTHFSTDTNQHFPASIH